MSFTKFNRRNKIFNTTTEGRAYIGLDKLTEGKIYPIEAIYINTKGKFEDSPVLATIDDTGTPVLVNCPPHLTETARQIMEDEEAVKEINAGKAGFKVYIYVATKYNRSCFGVEFVDR